VSASWAEVQARHARDPRFMAVVGEQKLVLFRSYLRMRQDLDDMRLDAAEKEFMVRVFLAAGPGSSIPAREKCLSGVVHRSICDSLA
jgi:hypothetical protein